MLKESAYIKIQVTVPTTHANAVREAFGRAGAGKQGRYDYCSASYPVTGRFRPLAGADPAVGEIGKLEEVAEEMITVICHRDMAAEVIAEIKRVHPYEEPAIDILPRLEVE